MRETNTLRLLQGLVQFFIELFFTEVAADDDAIGIDQEVGGDALDAVTDSYRIGPAMKIGHVGPVEAVLLWRLLSGWDTRRSPI